MIVDWIATDPVEAQANYVCACCQHRIDKGDSLYMAKKNGKTVKLCEECAASVEVDTEITQENREEWLVRL